MLASRFNQRFPKARRVSAAPRLLIALPYTARPKRRLVTPGEAPAAPADTPSACPQGCGAKRRSCQRAALPPAGAPQGRAAECEWRRCRGARGNDIEKGAAVGKETMMTEFITQLNGKINGVVWGTPMLVLLIGTGIYLSVRLRFFQVTRFGMWFRETALSLFRKDTVKSSESKAISQFQAMSAALAAALGTGNIAGVATALAAGGPGAVLWMWVSAVFGMMTGFSENVLGILFRKRNKAGEWSGGAMYYLRDGVGKKRGLKWLGKPLAALFALFCMLASFGIGNMTQVNSIADAMRSEFGVPTLATGAILAVISALVIVGGIKRIGRVTEKLVPAMAVLYIAACIAVLAMNFTRIPQIISAIISSAFGFRQVAGGISGYLIMNAVSVGFRRGVFSNEAGLGSSVAVNASSDVTEPVKQGMWAVFEIFFDTVVMCTLTALVLLSASGTKNTLEAALQNVSEQPQYFCISENSSLISGEPIPLLELAAENSPSGTYTELQAKTSYGQPFTIKLKRESDETGCNFINLMQIRGIAAKNPDGTPILNKNGEAVISKVELSAVNGASLVSYVFGQCFGNFAGKLLAVMVLLFAFSTVIGWSFNGAKSAEYLFGTKSVPLYRTVYVAFVLLGSTVSLTLAWDISDTLNGLMAIPNLIGVLILSGNVSKELSRYLRERANLSSERKQRKSAEKTRRSR